MAIAEGPCLHHRVTLAMAGCVSPAVQAAGWPLAHIAKGQYQQGSTGARELQTREKVVPSHLARAPLGCARPGRSSKADPHRHQRKPQGDSGKLLCPGKGCNTLEESSHTPDVGLQIQAAPPSKRNRSLTKIGCSLLSWEVNACTPLELG